MLKYQEHIYKNKCFFKPELFCKQYLNGHARVAVNRYNKAIVKDYQSILGGFIMPEFKVSKDELRNKAGETLEILKQDVSDEYVEANLNKLPIKNEYVRKYFVAIPAAVSLIALFFPFIGFSTGSGGFNTDVSYSGFDSLFGEYAVFTGWFGDCCPYWSSLQCLFHC